LLIKNVLIEQAFSGNLKFYILNVGVNGAALLLAFNVIAEIN